MVPGLNNFSQC